MTSKELYDFRYGFKTATLLADYYGKELAKHGRHDFNDIMQAFVVMSEKTLEDLLLRAGECSPSSSVLREAVQDVLSHGGSV